MLPNKEPISIIIVEDHSIFTEGLCSILQDVEGIRVAATFTEAARAFDFLLETPVDVVLLDISLPGSSGIELCHSIKQQQEAIKVIALSNHDEKSVIKEMLDAGANGYLLKNTSKKDLIDVIFKVTEGQFTMNEEVRNILFSSGPEQAAMPRLTRRELEILQLVSQGITTAAIAAQLFISIQTVESHRRNIMQKFKVNNAAAMVRMAIERNVIG